jgi:monoamine oxidase
VDKKAKTVPLDKPWECPDAKEWDSMSAETWMKKRFWTEAAYKSFEAFIHIVMAVEPSEVSFLYVLFYIHSAGGVDPLINTKGGAQDSKIEG